MLHFSVASAKIDTTDFYLRRVFVCQVICLTGPNRWSQNWAFYRILKVFQLHRLCAHLY